MKRMTFLIFEGVTVLELEDRQISIWGMDNRNVTNVPEDEFELMAPLY